MNIYHITHLDNLPRILAAGSLYSDRRLAEERPSVTIGFDHIKRRRLRIEVSCHPGTMVGDYVPFYFCPRSVMLFVISRRNDQLDYRGGQRNIVHLVSTVNQAIGAAGKRPWAFSDANAGAYYACFYNELERIKVLDWEAVQARYWNDPAVKEKKQAEFLVHDFFPWDCFHEIGVINSAVREQVLDLLGNAAQPTVNVRQAWYY